MRTFTAIFLSLLITLFVVGCNDKSQPQPPSEQPVTDSSVPVAPLSQTTETNVVDAQPSISIKKGIVMYQGTVRYMNLEGGFWGIITDSSQKLLPQNLPSEYKKDGLRLSFNAKEIKGMMTIQQWGTLSSLSDITVIGQVDSKASDPRI
ncbi:hypothetical protein [Shewanella baltica]|uniref:hypothetical protein n=1 Tax=Shewanella baltica TaxID=62322 RepID=UPI00217DC967|nr:hypothetical protein [Shewanella baltica]MCS6160337.1 hypothetical protein [Shewanella baltica]